MSSAMQPVDFFELFVKFSFNYNSDFIQKAFSRLGMADHLERKFDQYYKRYGADGAIPRFWCELDNEHKQAFADYIGTQKHLV